MAINLSKGGNINLSKTAPTMNKVDLGLGWNPRVTDGKAFDLDAVAFLTGENGKVRLDGDFIFFNQKTSPCGSVNHNGDNRTGDGDGDDETISVDLAKVPADVAKIVFAVTQDGSNFYDFGLFFKDIFKCKNALFLDGAISLMYLKNKKMPTKGGNFGPIISVSKK
jgi:tellurium resistance protein TerD